MWLRRSYRVCCLLLISYRGIACRISSLNGRPICWMNAYQDFFWKIKQKKKKERKKKKKKYRFNVVTCYTNSFYSIERETLLDENTRGEGKKEEINDRFHYYIGLAVISDGGERWRKVPWLSMRSIMATRGHFIEFQGKNSDYSRAIKAVGSPIRWDLAA